jgi:hypothetical protein
MTRFSVELYRPELLPQVLRLERSFWGTSRSHAAALFDWKYRQNPYTSEPLFYVGLREGQVVGARGMLGSCWEVGDSGERAVLPVAADLMIDPAHRDSGLYRALNDFSRADLERRGYTHMLNLSPTTANTIASVVTMGWRAVDAVRELSRREPSLSMAVRLRLGERGLELRQRAVELARAARAAIGMKTFRHLDRSARSGLGRHGSPISIDRRPRSQAMADLIHRIGSEARIRHVRDAAYFDWKLRNPVADYRFLYWGAPVLEGYLILQEQRTMLQVNILDWEARDPAIRTGLLRAALDWGRFRNLHVWSATLGDADRLALRDGGFSPPPSDSLTARHGRKLLVRPVGSAAEEKCWFLGDHRIDRADQWALRMLYSDMV